MSGESVARRDLARLLPERYGRGEIARMLDAAAPDALLDAAAEWDAAAGMLATVHDDLRSRAEALAADWDGAAAGACQHVLRRIAGTARQLARHAGEVRAALAAAAAAQQHARRQLAAFRAHPTLLGGIEVGGTGDHLLTGSADPALAAHLDETAQQWLRSVYDGYREALAALPDHIRTDLPGLVVPDPAVGAGPPPPHRPDPTTPAHTTPAHTTPAHTTPAHTTPAHTTPAYAGAQPAAAGLGTVAPGAGTAVVAGSAGAAYGGSVVDVGTTLAGGVGVGYEPLDPRQPDGGSWQGPGAASPAHETGLPAEPTTGPATPATPADPGTTPGGLPAEPGVAPIPATTDAGTLAGAIAQAVADAEHHGHHPADAPGMQADTPPVLDAPYIAGTVADQVAGGQHYGDAGAAAGSGPLGSGAAAATTPDPGTTDPIPDARPVPDPAHLPDAHAARH